MRQLGCEQNLVAQAQALKRRTHARLVAGIEIGRVQVVNPLLHRAGDDGIGRLRIGVSRRTGKPHAAQTQSGYSVTTFGVNTVLHGPSLRHQRPGKAKHNGHAAETSWNRNRERIVTQQKSSRHGTALTSAKSPMKGGERDHARGCLPLPRRAVHPLGRPLSDLGHGPSGRASRHRRRHLLHLP